MSDRNRARLALCLLGVLLLAGCLFLAARGVIDREWWKRVLFGTAAVFIVRVLLNRENDT